MTLNEKEIDALNKTVMAYPDIAEVHALNQEPMYMKDWLKTIDEYLKMARRDILTTKGRVTHKQALEKLVFKPFLFLAKHICLWYPLC